MSLQSFYPKSQIETALYTAGGEWQLADGTEYIGPYHRYIADGLVYTNSQYQRGVSKQLFPLQTNADINRYNQASKNTTKIWAIPRYIIPEVTEQHRTQGWMSRYFVQRRNAPVGTVVEIDSDQFDNIGTAVIGIDDILYASLQLRWRIVGTRDQIAATNRTTLITANQTFLGIVNYLTDLIEFSEFAPIRQQS